MDTAQIELICVGRGSLVPVGMKGKDSDCRELHCERSTAGSSISPGAVRCVESALVALAASTLLRCPVEVDMPDARRARSGRRFEIRGFG
jgi:hypothetical protein